jgi:mannose-6-phosphate isomerase-like protein (cupin superfamily)
MPTTFSDIGQALLALDADVSRTDTQPLISAHGHQWSVLTVAAGETWSTADAPSLPLSMVVLEGHATCADKSGRQSIGSGHVVILSSDTVHALINETSTPFRAALAWTRPSGHGEDE